MHTLQDTLESVIASGLDALGWHLEGRFLDLPQDKRFGDLSTNVAMRLAKAAKKPPQAMAALIIEGIRQQPLFQSSLQEYIEQIKVEGAGFINFYFSTRYYYDQLKGILSGGDEFFKSRQGVQEKVLLEFVSANPTGSLSVAHARQAAVGDALANILSFQGHAVTREYYLNDEGNQITILGNSIELRLRELKGEAVEFPQDHYQGEYIRDIAREILDKDLRVNDFSEYGGDYILAIIKKELLDFGVHFDSYFSQKALDKSGKIKETLELLKSKGFIFEEEGAVWFASTKFGDDKDRVVVKSDGSYTYLAPDIAYHRAKYDRGFTRLINFLGPDHHGYINRLKAAVSALGHDPESLSVIIVQLASIFRNGKPVQMSTRKGQYITLGEVLDEVGLDAARFFFLMRKTSSHLDFDLEVAKKQTSENPVYYCQYAYARICSILRTGSSGGGFASIDCSLLKEKEEIALIRKITQFPLTLQICAGTLDPYMLTVYLQELAEAFHKFYDLHRVLGQDQALTCARLALIEAARITLHEGLRLAGVSRPETM